MLMAAGLALDDSPYNMVVSPSRLERIFNETRVSSVVARRLPDLGDTRIQLIRVLGLLREHSAELFLTEKSPARQDLSGAFEVLDAFVELHGKAIKQGMECSPCRKGRPPANIDMVRAANMRSRGASFRTIAKALGVGESTIRRHLLHEGDEERETAT